MADKIKYRRSVSLEDISYFYSANSALELICTKYNKLIPDYSPKFEREIQHVIKKFQKA